MMEHQSSSPQDIASDEEDYSDAIYSLPQLDGIEDVEDYQPGGLHPVHLGDVLGDEQRYRVVHKLGSGGFAVVWLCRDAQTARYVGVKIVMAEKSSEDCLDLRLCELVQLAKDDPDSALVATPLDHFWIDGPNGRHLCLVLPVLGPRVGEQWFRLKRPERSLSLMAHCTTRGLAFLHRLGYCHGDFRPANILLRLSSLDSLTEDELFQRLGEPQIEPVYLQSGSFPGPEAPKYVIAPLDFAGLCSEWSTSDETYIIDFGQAFHTSTPPEELNIPNAYASPELFFNKRAGVNSDMWALACTLYEIRTGHKLFHDSSGDGQDVVLQWIQLLGKLPQRWWDMWDTKEHFDENRINIHGNPALQKLTLRDCLLDTSSVADPSTGQLYTITIDELELQALEDLLSSMLQYDEAGRINMNQVLEHEYWKVITNDYTPN